MSKQVSVPRFSTSQAPGGEPDWQQYSRAIQALAIFQQTVQAQPPLAAAGSVGGFLYGTMPFQGASFKVVLFQFSNFEGDGSYAFPTSFANIPAVLDTDQIDGSTVITSLNIFGISVHTGAATNGFMFLMGF